MLLHCSLGSKGQWRLLSRVLRERFRVIAIDLSGYGETPFPQDPERFALEQEAALVDQVVGRLLGPSEAFHLMGHSYGGATALRYVSTRPRRVVSLALFEPVSFHLLSHQDPAHRQVTELAEALGGDMAAGLQSQAAQRFVDYWGGAGAYAASAERTREAFDRGVEKVMLDFQALLEEPLDLEGCRKMTVPTCLMAGIQSRRPALQVVELLAGILPCSALHWVTGGHMSPLTNPEQVNAVIRDHLEMYRDQKNLEITPGRIHI